MLRGRQVLVDSGMFCVCFVNSVCVYVCVFACLCVCVCVCVCVRKGCVCCALHLVLVYLRPCGRVRQVDTFSITMNEFLLCSQSIAIEICVHRIFIGIPTHRNAMTSRVYPILPMTSLLSHLSPPLC